MEYELPQEAAEDFADQLRRAIGCIFEQVHLKVPPSVFRKTENVHTFSLNQGQPQPLHWPGNHRPQHLPPLSLATTIFIRLVTGDSGGFRVTTSGYSYQLRAGGHEQNRELLTWQWDQRGSTSQITYPHVHVAASHDLFSSGLGPFHVPTGRVLVEDVVEFCIVQFEVAHRENWQEILSRNRETHNVRRTQR